MTPRLGPLDVKFRVPVMPGRARGLVGLANLGNTCFMNACLQCICNTPPLCGYLLNGSFRKDLNQASRPTRGQLSLAFASLLGALWGGKDHSSARPSEVRELLVQHAPHFGDYGQHDTQEFMRFLLDGLHEELNLVTQPVPYQELLDIQDETDVAKSDRFWRHYKERNDSALVDIFCGQLRSAVLCASCGHMSSTFDPFYDLSLPIPHSREAELEQCLLGFTAEEPLCEDYKCEQCSQAGCCTRQLKVYRWPRVIVVHLKRFAFSMTQPNAKLHTKVRFPVQDLDLSAHGTFVENPPPVYDLYGVANHLGCLSGGHYTALCRNFEDGSWVGYDDARVSPGLDPEQAICGRSAYLLFYKRQDV